MTNNTPNLQQQIINALKGKNSVQVERFAAYCQRLLVEKDRDGAPKNPWMKTKTAAALAALFNRVAAEGLVFDGKHITLQKRGITYDYVAYKNKMLVAYPETKFDLNVVCKGDTFESSNTDGVLTYKHVIADPFAEKPEIIGAFAVIRNKRGDFLTVLNKADIQKHRAVAQTDSIWSAWFKEMVLKTVMRKATKYHFDDVFEGMNEIDNEQYDLDVVILPEEDRTRIEAAVKQLEGCKTLEALQVAFKSMPPQLIKNDEVFEAYSGMKSELTPAPAKKKVAAKKPAAKKAAKK